MQIQTHIIIGIRTSSVTDNPQETTSSKNFQKTLNENSEDIPKPAYERIFLKDFFQFCEIYD